MRVLVIGGSGYIGAAIADAFEREHGADVLTLSRSGRAPVGTGVTGDVTAPGLGLSEKKASWLLDGLTHVVSCFGSVSWTAGPREAYELHRDGTRAVLDFTARSPTLERVVHVSSVLALGLAEGPLENDVLDVGQEFRCWYEYGKFLAEHEARERSDLPVRIVRVGPLLGAGGPVGPSARHGILSALPILLGGYPIPLERNGCFPCYAGDVVTAGRVIARAAAEPDGRRAWTWFDGRNLTLAQVLAGLCAAWGTIPLTVDLPFIGWVARAASGRLNLPEPLGAYAGRWPKISPRVLEDLPANLPKCPPGYVEETGAALRATASETL